MRNLHSTNKKYLIIIKNVNLSIYHFQIKKEPWPCEGKSKNKVGQPLGKYKNEYCII